MCSSIIHKVKGDQVMTENERQLIDIIRNNENPEQALITATAIILDYLTRHESFEARAADCPRVPA